MHKLLPSSLALSFLLFSLAISGCKKDDTDNISRIKNYPSIVLDGGAVYAVNQNETFTDPGFVATLGDTPLTPIVTGSVDTSTKGIYVLSYTGANTEGDTVSVIRSVVVTDPAVNNVDQSGTFKRGTFADTPVTKVGNKGVYKIDNFGFTNSPNLFPAYFVQIDASHIVVPPQVIPGLGYTTFTGVNGTFDATGRLTQISYAIHAPGIFGTSVRSATRL